LVFVHLSRASTSNSEVMVQKVKNLDKMITPYGTSLQFTE
jgi:hypothetical protein